MPTADALEKAKKKDNTYVLHLGSDKGNNDFTHESAESWYYQYITNGKFIALSSDEEEIVFKSYIPSYGNHVITGESIAYSLDYIQESYQIMLQNELKTNKKLFQVVNKREDSLKNKTLLFPKDWLGKGLSEKKIKKMYNANFEIVSQNVWKDAIINKEAGKAYIIVVPVLEEEEYIYQLYICDTETSFLYGIIETKTVANPEHVNISKSNIGYITKSDIKDIKL